MFKFLVELESLDRSRSGAIWGNVWHEFGGHSFPHRAWNDMIVPYVTAFAHATREALGGSKAQVMFFDGPFSVEIVLDGTVVRLNPEGGDLPACEIGSAELASKVLSVGNRLIDACEQRGWGEDDDVHQLKSAIQGLMQLEV